MLNIIKIYNENKDEPMTFGKWGLGIDGKVYYRSSAFQWFNPDVPFTFGFLPQGLLEVGHYFTNFIEKDIIWWRKGLAIVYKKQK